MFGFNVQPAIAREFGVRTGVPWRDLTAAERQIVLDGPEEKKHITVTSVKGVHDLDFTFRNARLTVLKELERAGADESGKRLARVDRFLSAALAGVLHGKTPSYLSTLMPNTFSMAPRYVRDFAARTGFQSPERDAFDALDAKLTRLYRDPRRLLLASVLHLLGWIGTGLGTWISLRLLGCDAGLLPVLALEALLDALVAAAFVVPGSAGVQEAGYVGLGAAFGVPPDMALGVSLLRRARDLALGVPILLAFQWVELRRIK